jgi:hypothetical protein
MAEFSALDKLKILGFVYNQINRKNTTQSISLNKFPEAVGYLEEVLDNIQGASVENGRAGNRLIIIPSAKGEVRQRLQDAIITTTEEVQQDLEIRATAYLQKLAEKLASYSPGRFNSLPDILTKINLSLGIILGDVEETTEETTVETQVNVETYAIGALEELLEKDNSALSKLLIPIFNAALSIRELSDKKLSRNLAIGAETVFVSIINNIINLLKADILKEEPVLIPKQLKDVVAKGIELYEKINDFRIALRNTGLTSTPNGELVFARASQIAPQISR